MGGTPRGERATARHLHARGPTSERLRRASVRTSRVQACKCTPPLSLARRRVQLHGLARGTLETRNRFRTACSKPLDLFRPACTRPRD
eukprot:5276991-Pyramimonas_sp.AAC.1